MSNRGKKKSKGTNREIKIPEVDVVQNVIERCIRKGMKRDEIIELLGSKFDPALILIVWNFMKSENEEYFKHYYMIQYVGDHIAEYNRMLEEVKIEYDMASNSNATNNYIHKCSDQNRWHDSSDSATFNIHNTASGVIPYDHSVSNMREEFHSDMAMSNYNCARGVRNTISIAMQSNKVYDGRDVHMTHESDPIETPGVDTSHIINSVNYEPPPKEREFNWDLVNKMIV